MNLRAVASGAVGAVNPEVAVVVNVSDGYTIGPGRKQIPKYKIHRGAARIQALDGKDLKQLDGLNITGTIRAIYMSGSLAGVIRPEGKGGDTVQMKNKAGSLETWLVVKVLESWPGWTKAAICLQQA